jgi:8-oxo-dGTP pyrophosphatase MutT (NUDIX family)
MVLAPMPAVSVDDVRRALTLPDFDPHAAQLRMAPRPRPIRRPDRAGQPRLSGVLILLYPYQDQLYFALTKRPEYNGIHSGQISLPGGKREGTETLIETALRETCEEVGVCDGIDVLGTLAELYIPPSDFEVHPAVGYIAQRPVWRPDSLEVAALIETPLSTLFDEDIKGSEAVFRADVNMTLNIYFYLIDGHKVWGATAAILSEFEARLRAAINLPFTSE